MNHLLLILTVALLFACQSPQEETKKELSHLFIDMPQGVGWDQKDSCSFLYVSAQKDSFLLKGGLKCRGGLSSAYGKHNYSLEFTKDFELCNLPAEDDWILHASYIDKTFMRHKLSYDLFRQMSPQNIAPQSSFIQVTYNGDYHGIYLAMQRVNAKILGLSKKDTTAFLFKEPGIFYEHSNQQESKTGNYYFQKHPKFKKVDKHAHLARVNHFLFHASDAEFLADVGKYFDLDNIVDWHLLLLLSNNSDGILKNFYCYQVKDGKGLRIIPWDYDHAFGRDGNGDRNDLERNVDPQRAVLIQRLMTIELNNDYPRKLRERYAELRRSGVFSEINFNTRIEEMRQEILPYIQRNFEQWPVNGAYYPDSNDFEIEVKILSDYFPKRLKMLDNRFGYQK
ncbi:CotH protein [Lishizhenia tianjinensis]|uniref:CotH protein n=1 Tax=Lishizhenia tianjinensis TaxID=477690 RepID=A0A1I6YXK4_9FLAO|nr:CotH kinase family protein [Lishizhenia tianjinensis]SFT55038.1 CotH protein [Lishizhenia tianjinensis]